MVTSGLRMRIKNSLKKRKTVSKGVYSYVAKGLVEGKAYKYKVVALKKIKGKS